MPKTLVVVVDLRDRLHAWVVGTGTRGLVPAAPRLFLCTSRKYGPQRGEISCTLVLAASHGLANEEQQRGVGVDALRSSWAAAWMPPTWPRS